MKEIVRRFPRVAPCLLAIIVDYAGYGLVYPLVTALFSSKGGMFATVDAHNFLQGLAYLLYPLAMFFGASILGDLSDKYGRKHILQFSLLGIFLSYGVMGYSLMIHSLPLFLVARALSGLFAGCQPLAQAVVADVSTQEEKKWSMGLISLANDFGLIVGPLIAGFFTMSFFVERGGYIYPFFFVGILALATFLWLCFGFKESYTQRVEKKIGFLRPLFVFVDAFKDPLLRPLVIILLLFQISVGLVYQMLSIYLAEQYHFSSSQLGYFYGYIGFFLAAGVLLFYPAFLRRFHLVTVVAVGLFGEAVAMFFLGAVHNLAVTFIFAAIFGITNIFAWTGYLGYYSQHVDKDHQGWAMGIFASCVATGFVIAGLMTNALPYIGVRAQIAIGGVVSALAGALLLLYHTSRGRS
ncbi:MAG: Multidrug resistance protein MdtG [Chlamydiales bacterium]|nr:Multidrug resistance protein MdtG [Chlamydiales bacterium]MCH9635897.1 Multidrug resistance protein MdtG [Chlamydiales bacterium]MCH9703878.1 MFS transporter [Chlamydiota bacterium]